VRLVLLGYSEGVRWDAGQDPASVYEDFSDTGDALLLTGLYQYTFRDLSIALDLFGRVDPAPADAFLAGWRPMPKTP
jgi:hypothetical protein